MKAFLLPGGVLGPPFELSDLGEVVGEKNRTERRQHQDQRHVSGREDPPLPDRLGYRGTTVLSLSPALHRFRHTSVNAFELETPSGALVDGAWPQSLRGHGRPLVTGDTISVNGYTAQILDDRDGRPTRAAFRFDRSLDVPTLALLYSEGQNLKRFVPPELGLTTTLPPNNPFLPHDQPSTTALP